MIRVTRFDGTSVMLNADFIQSVENTPDTLITLTTGEKIIVQNSLDAVVTAFKEYKWELNQKPEQWLKRDKVENHDQ